MIDSLIIDMKPTLTAYFMTKFSKSNVKEYFASVREQELDRLLNIDDEAEQINPMDSSLEEKMPKETNFNVNKLTSFGSSIRNIFKSKDSTTI